jgi:hypothetical protein
LTAFSFITTISGLLPFLTPNPENNNPDLYRFQALSTLLNHNSSSGDNLSAHITLHDSKVQSNSDVQSLTAKVQPDVLLSYGAMNYNINQTSKASNFISHTQCKIADCSQKVWYFNRTLDINKPNNNNVHEDRKCNTNNWVCTQKELADIHNNISSLSQIGYPLQFYNGKSPVDSLEKPLDTFVHNLHLLIIISFIIVFIAFLTWREKEKISQLFAR